MARAPAPKPAEEPVADAPAPTACASCPHWLKRDHLASRSGVGSCRRNAPNTGGMHGGQFPLTRAGDVCGEHPDIQFALMLAMRRRLRDADADGAAA